MGWYGCWDCAAGERVVGGGGDVSEPGGGPIFGGGPVIIGPDTFD